MWRDREQETGDRRQETETGDRFNKLVHSGIVTRHYGPKRRRAAALQKDQSGVEPPHSKKTKAASSRRTPKSRALQSSVAEVLSHHQAAEAAVHDADAEAAKLWTQDILAMSR